MSRILESHIGPTGSLELLDVCINGSKKTVYNILFNVDIVKLMSEFVASRSSVYIPL